MSPFNHFEAERLAAMAFRFRADKFTSHIQQNMCGNPHRPLVGKEHELLEVLLAGEQRYRDCKRELEIILDLRSSDRKLPVFCAQMANNLSVIQNALRGLDYVSRTEMDSIARCLGSDADEMHAHIDRVLQWLRARPDIEGIEGEKAVGRKRGLSNAGVLRLPLEEFAKEIRNFLLSPDVRIKFSFKAITRHDREGTPREPVSAAARLLYEGALLLDSRVEVADIDEVMRAVNQNPEFREELFDDPTVDSLTA